MNDREPEYVHTYIKDVPRDFPPQVEFRPPKHRNREDDDQSDNYYKPRQHRRRSKVNKVLDDLGLSGVVAAITGQNRSQSKRARSRRDSFNSDRSTRARKKWQQAATATLLTGAAEAWRSRNEPGGLTGPKGKRIATAALSAAGINAFLDKNPDEKSKCHVAESVIGGLVTNRLANGPRGRSSLRGRSSSRSRSSSRGRSDSRSRSPAGYGDHPRPRPRFSLGSLSHHRFGRSQSCGSDDSQSRRSSGPKDLAALGDIAAAGKAFYDRVRSKFRGRDHSRSHNSSENSFVPTHRQRYGCNRGALVDVYDDNRIAGEGRS